MPSTPTHSPARDEEISRLFYSAGLSQSAIARRLGVSRQRIHQILTTRLRHSPALHRARTRAFRTLTPAITLIPSAVSLAAQLRSALAERSLTVTDLQHRLSYSSSTLLSRILSARHNPTLSTIDTIAAALNLQAHILLEVPSP